MLRSPKERFVHSTHAGPWGKICSGEVFEEAMHAALDQLAFDMTAQDTQVPQQACDAHQQMAGARKYMEILCSLHTPETTPKSTKPKSLDYEAGV